MTATIRTVLDVFRMDQARPRAAHYTHWTSEGKRSLSTQEFFATTAAIAEGLAKLGVGDGDKVLLLSDNRPEWHMIDLATLSLGAADVPVYPTLTELQVAYQARDSQAIVAITEGPTQMTAMIEVKDGFPNVKHFVQIDGPTVEGAMSLDELVASGTTGDEKEKFWQRADQVTPDQLATIVYTSGTTGLPKGVMLTHGNFAANITAALERVTLSESDLALEFLPLCHVFERCVGYCYMALSTSRAYCSPSVVAEMLPKVAPTAFVSVPRLYEKIHAKIIAKVAAAPAKRQKMFHWAHDIGSEVSRLTLACEPIPIMLRLKHMVADKLVLSKVRMALGGRVRLSLSGGASLPTYINEFFHSLGLPIVEGYGLTETSPALAVNGVEPGMLRIGSVGKPVSNVEVKIAEDGEILARGPSITQGYWNKPDQTKDAFDDDGFLLTGDIGYLDDDNFLFITDRKKDLIVTAGGKNMAPQPVENQLKRSRYVDNAVLIGDGRPYIAALISPEEDELRRWAIRQKITTTDIAKLVENQKVIELFRGVVEATNAGLARFEQIKRFRLLPLELSVDGGHLTPTMKVKRKVVVEEFALMIDTMYSKAKGE